MAGSLDVDNQVTGFLLEEDNAVEKTLSLVTRAVQRKSVASYLENDIINLEKEITELSKAINQRQIEIRNKTDALYELQYGERKHKPVDELEKEIVSLQKKINRTQEITGLIIDEYVCDEINEGDDPHVMYTVAGSVHNTDFHLEFIAKKNDNEAGDYVQIENMKISVEDWVVQDLSEYLVSIDKKNALPKFFSLVENYSRWNQYRKRTFSHFVEEYPDLVKVSEEDITVLQIQDPECEYRPTFNVFWDFRIEALYLYKPDIKLEVLAHKNLYKKDKGKALTEAPQMFQKMLQSLGIERSIHTLIQILMDT